MGVVSDQAFVDFTRQIVKTLGESKTLYENECPGYNDLTENEEELEFDIRGYRMPFIATRPGGHSNVVPNNSSFNQSVPLTTVSSFIYPTWYYLPMVWSEAAIHLAKRNPQRLIEFGDLLKEWWNAGLKRQEYYTYGDGSGLLAVASGSTLTVGANQTLTGTTAAGTTYGQTKGVFWLDQNSSYEAVNPSTGLPRGGFTVTTQGSTTCTVTVNWGSIVSGDIITDPGSYLKAPRGYAFLLSNVSRTLQGLPTSRFQQFNSPTIDLANTLLTPATYQTLKAFLQYRYNKESAKNGLYCVMPFGQHAVLSKQGWNLAVQSEKKTMGYAMSYQDGDTKILATADMDEDRGYFRFGGSIKKFVETDMKTLSLGTGTGDWIQLMGTNGTGSADYARALECHWNAGVVTPRPGAYFTRASTAGVATQVSSF